MLLCTFRRAGNTALCTMWLSNRTLTSANLLFNPLNAELNPICHLLALLGAHHILHVTRIRVNSSSLSKALKTETMLKVFSILFRSSHSFSFVTVRHYFLLRTQHRFCVADNTARPSPSGIFVYHLDKYKLLTFKLLSSIQLSHNHLSLKWPVSFPENIILQVISGFMTLLIYFKASSFEIKLICTCMYLCKCFVVIHLGHA